MIAQLDVRIYETITILVLAGEKRYVSRTFHSYECCTLIRVKAFKPARRALVYVWRPE